MGISANKEKAYAKYFANKHDEAIKIFDELIKVNGLYRTLFEMQFPESGSDKEYS